MTGVVPPTIRLSHHNIDATFPVPDAEPTQSQMKNAVLLFLFIPLFSFGQEEAPVNKNEFGVNVFSLKRFQAYKSFDNDNVISPGEPHWVIYGEPHILPGIYYKRHFGKNALRSSFEFTRRATTGTGEGGPWYFPEGSSLLRKNVGISIGYERAFGTKKLQPFAFADLGFNYENMDGTYTLQGYGGPPSSRHFIFEDYEYSVGAGGGLRYKMNARVHFTYEISAQGYRNAWQDILRPGSGKNWDMGYHINPVNKLGVAILL